MITHNNSGRRLIGKNETILNQSLVSDSNGTVLRLNGDKYLSVFSHIDESECHL